MSRRRSGSRLGIILVLLLVAAAGVLWYLIGPGPLDFAGGKNVALASYGGAKPTGVPAELRQADLLTRGKYLTQAADCEACHTVVGEPSFAGGRAFKTPFGTLYAPNITADKATGIGNWSDADFVKAVHKGVTPDGTHLYPAFPYASYTRLTDDDVLAIKAYLFSLPPVAKRAPPADLAFPFNQRWLMVFWGLFYNSDQRFEPNADRSADWNRGAYLVEALAHCGDCHTPRNLLQALDNRQKFAGAVTAGWRAFNITADRDAGIGAWSDADIAHYLATGHAAGRGSASGPMAEAVDFSLRYLTAGDVAAMVAYLRTIPAIPTADLPPPKAEPAPAAPKVQTLAALDPHGQRVFAGACAGCHGWTGISPLGTAATLVGTRAINDPSAMNVAQLILCGSGQPAPGGGLTMPGFGRAYSDVEIAAVANYATARFGAKGSTITALDVAKLRTLQ